MKALLQVWFSCFCSYYYRAFAFTSAAETTARGTERRTKTTVVEAEKEEEREVKATRLLVGFSFP